MKKWRSDPVAFIEEVLINPESGRPFEVFEAERVFLRHAFTPAADGDLPYRDILWSCIKKSGKSTFGALCCLYTTVCLGGRFAEAYVIANDLQQSTDRIFTAAARIVQASPMLRAKITADRITFSNGSFIQALAADYRGGAGVEPVFVVADEIWGFTSESSQRLYEEVTTTPTRKPSVRMITSYAGFSGESVLLEGLVKRGLMGTEIAKDLYVQPGMIAFISHDRIAPWQSAEWLEDARRSTRASAFLRQYCNEFTSAESAFIDVSEWDECTDPTMSPVLSDHHMSVWAGLDLGLKHDSTALVACGWHGDRIRVVCHQIFVPRGGETLDVTNTAEAAVLSLASRFSVQAVFYDPWQGIALSQRLTRAGVRMTEWAQSLPNLSLMAGNLLELIKRRQLVCYPAADLRQAISKTVAIENPRGWRLGKAKQSDRVDPVIALAMAANAAVQGQGAGFEAWEDYARESAIFSEAMLNRAAAAGRAYGVSTEEAQAILDRRASDAEELIAAYEAECARIDDGPRDCASCGRPLGQQTVSCSDGRARHPECTV